MEYLRCYDSYANDQTKEQLWNLIKQGQKGFISDRRICLRIWMPDNLVTLAVLIDSSIVRRAGEDYIL